MSEPSAGSKVRAAILVSGGGSNMEALIRAAKAGRLPKTEIALVLSNKKDAAAVQKAESHGVKTIVIESKNFSGDDAEFQAAVLKTLQEHRIDVVCLAGYLKKIGPEIVAHFRDRILNIHPALLPRYGGSGMYGQYVHQAVIKAGDPESGCSVHLVDDEFDHGRVIAQSRVPVMPGDTPERLAERILEQEHKLYPQVVAEFCERLAAKGTAQ